MKDGRATTIPRTDTGLPLYPAEVPVQPTASERQALYDLYGEAVIDGIYADADPDTHVLKLIPPEEAARRGDHDAELLGHRCEKELLKAALAGDHTIAFQGHRTQETFPYVSAGGTKMVVVDDRRAGGRKILRLWIAAVYALEGKGLVERDRSSKAKGRLYELTFSGESAAQQFSQEGVDTDENV